MANDELWYAVVRIEDGTLLACTQSLHDAATWLTGHSCSGQGPTFAAAREAARDEARRLREMRS